MDLRTVKWSAPVPTLCDDSPLLCSETYLQLILGLLCACSQGPDTGMSTEPRELSRAEYKSDEFRMFQLKVGIPIGMM